MKELVAFERKFCLSARFCKRKYGNKSYASQNMAYVITEASTSWFHKNQLRKFDAS